MDNFECSGNGYNSEVQEAEEIFQVTEIEGKLKTSLVGARQGCVHHITASS